MDQGSNEKVISASAALRTAVEDCLPDCKFKDQVVTSLDEIDDIVATVIDATPVGTSADEAVADLDKLATKPHKPTAKK